MLSFIEPFKDVPDPRVERTKAHKLIDILFITYTAILCGCDDWYAIERFAYAKESWFGKYLELPNGLPSHDTLNRVISLLDPQILREKFINWVSSVVQFSQGTVVSMDGKRLKNSGLNGKSAIVHMVSAWSRSNHMVLGMYKVEDKSNEIKAIPQLLEILDLKDCVITIDAMGCQTQIAQQIADKGAHYILAVKDNQSRLLEDIKEAFAYEKPNNIQVAIQQNLGHGRIEKRTCRVIQDTNWICNKENWKELHSLIEITAERINKKTADIQTETRYYISDLIDTAQQFNINIREHWGIENEQHWILDVAFNEDQSKKMAGNSAENIAILNRLALNVLKQDKTSKASIKTKRLMAGWQEDYLDKIINILKI